MYKTSVVINITGKLIVEIKISPLSKH